MKQQDTYGKADKRMRGYTRLLIGFRERRRKRSDRFTGNELRLCRREPLCLNLGITGQQYSRKSRHYSKDRISVDTRDSAYSGYVGRLLGPGLGNVLSCVCPWTVFSTAQASISSYARD